MLCDFSLFIFAFTKVNIENGTRKYSKENLDF